MNTNDIVYIPTPTTESPDKFGLPEGKYGVAFDGHFPVDQIEFVKGNWGRWFVNEKTFWLRPVKLSDLLKEAREQAWNAGVKHAKWVYSGKDHETFPPNKEAYFNSFTQQIEP